MNTKKPLIMAVCAVSFGFAALNVSAQSGGARDRLKAEKCYATDGKVIPCNAPADPAAPVAKYPNATRVEPEAPKTKIKKEWAELVKASNEKNPDALLAAAQAVLDNPDANINEKAEAANQSVQAHLSKGGNDYTQPIRFAKKAIELNGLGNNAHFQLMYVLSQMLLADKQYVDSLLYVDRFAKETGIEDLTVLKNRGNALYRLERYPEAIISLKKAYELDKGADPNLATLLVDSYNKTGQKAEAKKLADAVTKALGNADPNDTNAQVRQLLVLANAKQYKQAAEVFDALYAKGDIKTVAEYEAGYVSYSYIEGKEDQAIKIINDGIAKGIIKPDMMVYNILGQSYYYSNQAKGAIDAWGKAAALSPKGEYDALQARVLAEEGEYAKAKEAVMRALKKGVENKGDVYLILAEAESEFGLNNRDAWIAALREAAKYPESQSQANTQLKQAGLK